MINDPDRWNNIDDILKEQHYISVKSYHYLALLYTKWLFIYLFGNYWLRTIGLVTILA